MASTVREPSRSSSRAGRVSSCASLGACPADAARRSSLDESLAQVRIAGIPRARARKLSSTRSASSPIRHATTSRLGSSQHDPWPCSGGSRMNHDHQQKIQANQLQRNAYLYVRQSTLHQVFENTESTQRQYALRD